jgi:putative sugar O-methyltransferase
MDRVSLNTLKGIYECGKAYINYLGESGLMARRNDASPFWQAIFQQKERRDYPEFNDMLMMRRGATYALADRAPVTVNDFEDEREHAQHAYFVMSQSVPNSYFQELHESPLGCPVCFDFQGRMFSAGAITNALTSYRILEWCQSTGLDTHPLRILEIGAGYGQVAYQLFQKLKITSYTICDLPENLFLSAFYLQANLPNRKAVFVKEHGLPGNEPAELVFLVPPLLHMLSGPFDLVINSYSFQEMNRVSVEEYFAYAESRLTSDGLFYSLNAHRKSGIVWPSDYPVEKFKLLSFLPVRKYPFQVFATNPYETVMAKRTAPALSSVALTHFKQQFDALGGALQLGLHDEVLEICRKFSSGQLNEEEGEWLDNLCKFFHASDYGRKERLLEAMKMSRYLLAIVAYLAGSLEFAHGNLSAAQTLLEEAVNELAASHAKARCCMMLACMAYKAGMRSAGENFCAQAYSLTPHLRPEMTRFIQDYHLLAPQVTYQLYLDLPAGSSDRLREGLYGLVRRKLSQMVRGPLTPNI